MGKKEPSGSTVNCPKCEKPVSAQGFAGHMRWKHGVDSDPKAIFKTMKNEATNAEKGVRLYELMDLLAECRDRKSRVEEMLEKAPIFPLFSRDEPAEAIKRGLEDQEKQISAELVSLGYGVREEGS